LTPGSGATRRSPAASSWAAWCTLSDSHASAACVEIRCGARRIRTHRGSATSQPLEPASSPCADRWFWRGGITGRVGRDVVTRQLGPAGTGKR
jgi:hypothetical protein